MLTENFIAATYSANKPSTHLSGALKDVGVFIYEYQPHSIYRQGFKKSSVHVQGLATSDNHVFAAQVDKAVVHVYSRARGNQEAIVPLPEKITSVIYAEQAAVLIIGTENGKLILWEVATGRISTSAASHLQPVTHLSISRNNDRIVSGSSDTNLHIWSLSRLLSFTPPASSHDGSNASRSPLRTFSDHRSAIKALTLGHSATSTNFAVSASSDRICYLWHLETSQVLRAVLFPTVPLCATIDPADRAVYIGCENGTIHNIDFFGASTHSSLLSIFEAYEAPIQMTDANGWKSTSETGPALCVTLSYDGTSLLSGHESGKIIRWDVAKHRTISEVANLHQPVSCINMLAPVGLPEKRSVFAIPNIVKPKLELSIRPDQASLDIPSSYTIQSQIVNNELSSEEFDANGVSLAITEPGWPEKLMEDALRALMYKSTPVKQSGVSVVRDVATEAQNARLMEENEALKAQVSKMLRHAEEQRVQHFDRMRRREALRKDRIEAYSLAQKTGKDGDTAMQSFEDAEQSIDIESEQEHLKDSTMQVDG